MTITWASGWNNDDPDGDRPTETPQLDNRASWDSPVDDLADLFGADNPPASEHDPEAPTVKTPNAPPDTAPGGGEEHVEPDQRRDTATRPTPDQPGQSGQSGPPRPSLRPAGAAALESAPGADRDDEGDAIAQARSQRRWERAQQLYEAVDLTLMILSRDAAISAQLTDFTLTRDADADLAQRRRFREMLEPALAHAGRVVVRNPSDIEDVFNMAYAEYIGLGPLDELWWDDQVTEILVDSPERVYVERNGRLSTSWVRFRSLEHAQSLARTLSAKISDRAVNPSNPLVTAELPGARVTFCYGTGVVKSGISITIRKFKPLMGMDALLTIGALSDDMAAFLADCVRARATALVSGGTGTGKTTMVNALSGFVPDSERIVTIEDAFELALSNKYIVSLQTKEAASSDDTVRITQADLLVNSLRMRPDRIIVGEIREPDGARVMIQAASTGHDGTMSTIHANTAHVAVNSRLMGLLRTATGMSDDVAAREVATAIDLVVQVTRRAGIRFISEIATVDVSDIRGQREIVPRVLFTGALDTDGRPAFRQVAALGDDTVLWLKFTEAGIDPSRWSDVGAKEDENP